MALPSLVIALLILASAEPGRTGRTVAQTAVARLLDVQASSMGVDRAGNLWAWKFGSGTVQVLSPDGRNLRQEVPPGASAIDVDSEWGFVGLFEANRELRWSDGVGKESSLRLQAPASSVCWVGPLMVAVAPQTAFHRIEVWNLQSRSVAATMGNETPIRPIVGATRLRGVLLRYDPRKELIYSLESFTGDFQVFSRDGELAWRTSVPNPRKKALEDWLAQVDKIARAAHDIQTPTLFPLKLALSPSGAPWVSQEQDYSGRLATFMEVTAQSNRPEILREEPCASSNFVFWHDRLVLFRDPASPQGACVSARPFS